MTASTPKQTVTVEWIGYVVDPLGQPDQKLRTDPLNRKYKVKSVVNLVTPMVRQELTATECQSLINDGVTVNFK